jgi:rhamnogalacturonyl hydrolase YesR
LLIAAGFHKWDIAAKMTTQHDTRHGNMTRTIRWHEIARAALVLGIIEDYSKGSIFKLRALLVRQLEAGRTVQTSRGRYAAVLSDERDDKFGDPPPGMLPDGTLNVVGHED